MIKSMCRQRLSDRTVPGGIGFIVGLCLLFILAIAGTAKATDYVVRGTLFPDVTGVYLENGTYDGHPSYYNTTAGYWLWHAPSLPGWAISAQRGPTGTYYWYRSNENPFGTYTHGGSATGTANVFLYPTLSQVNQHPDCKIAFLDFALFADDWQQTGVGLTSDFDGSGTVDIYDLSIFASYWLQGSDTIAPIVQNETFSLLKKTSHTFNINATSSLSLTYTVESLPTKGSVYTSANTLITSVPYVLPDSTIKYTAGDYNDVNDSFTFAASDGSSWTPPCGGKVTATASIFIQNGKPSKATNPSPDINSINIAVDSNLTWSAGAGTITHLVYLGTTNPPVFQKEQDGNIFDPNNLLTYDVNYYWRIDENSPNGVTTGDVWSFHTIISPTVPVAFDGTASAYTYIVCPITLIATDDGTPNPPARLKYFITSLPADVNAYLQDPVSGGSSRIDTNHLPYKLSSWGNTVLFATSTVGVSDFNFKAYDGNSYSDTNKVNINTIANLQDCLSFDGSGYVTIPHNTLMNLSNGRGIAFYINTRSPYLGILKKHGTGAGYEIGLIGGKLTGRVYDVNNTMVAQIQSGRRYDNGQWSNCAIMYKTGKLELYTGYGDVIPDNPVWYNNQENLSQYGGDVNVPTGTYTNTDNVIVGRTSDANYNGEIDNIRFYSSLQSDNFRSLICVQVRTFGGSPELGVPNPVIRFFIDTIDTWDEDEGTGYDGSNNTETQIYDDKSTAHLIGTFDPNHVRYYPFYWHWYDSAAAQQGAR